MRIRRITRGVQLGQTRIYWLTSNWRSKSKPFWFFARYQEGTWSFQSMRFEIWRLHGG